MWKELHLSGPYLSSDRYNDAIGTLNKFTVLTQIQDNSNLRLPPPYKTHLPRENVYIQISDDPSKITHLLRKNILLLTSYSLYTMHIYLYQSVSLSPYLHSQCLHLPHTHF